MLEQSILKSLEERSKKFKFVFYDQETGESMSSNEVNILEEVLRRNKEGEDFVLVNNKYLLEQGLETGCILRLLDTLQEKRKMIMNYEEYQLVSEFLFLHDADFKVTNIDSDNDKLTLHLF